MNFLSLQEGVNVLNFCSENMVVNIVRIYYFESVYVLIIHVMSRDLNGLSLEGELVPELGKLTHLRSL